jgi:site-specific DNA recombinase
VSGHMTLRPAEGAAVPAPVPRKSRAAIYLRVSTTEQAETDFGAEGFSIPAQREACRRKAEALGATVVEEYLDRGESARSAARPQLQAMLERLRLAGDLAYVIVHKLDRLARSREDDVAIVMDIRAAGAQIISATENIDETPSGKLLHGIMATIAEFYSSNLSAEAKKGMEQKARFGGTVGLAPVGYRNTSAEVEGREVRTVAVDEARAAHVVWAFEQFATGEWTVGQMHQALAERGLTARPTRRYPERPLSRSRVHRMLRNPYYLGIVTYNGVQYLGRHRPLVSAGLFEEVQGVLDKRSVGGERPIRRTHYLKGMLACGKCRSRLGISFNRSHTGQRYAYFFCLGRQAKNGCDLPYLPMEQVEVQVERFWQRVRIEPDEAEGIRSDVRALIQLAAAQHETELATQRERLVRLDGEEHKALQAHYADAISLDLLKGEQRRIRGERIEAEKIIAGLTTEHQALERALDEVLSRVDRCDEAYRAGSPQVRRELCFAVFNRIYLEPEGVAGCDLSVPFAHVLSSDLSGQIEREAEAIRSGSLSSLLPEAEEEQGPAELAFCAAHVERPSGRFPWERKNPGPFRDRGSNFSLLVGVAGFEPTTSSSRTKRAAKLRHTP